MFMQLFAAGLLLFVCIAAFIGVFKAHILPDGLYFGTSTASLSLIAFAISVTLFIKQVNACATPCEACKLPPVKKK